MRGGIREGAEGGTRGGRGRGGIPSGGPWTWGSNCALASTGSWRATAMRGDAVSTVRNVRWDEEAVHLSRADTGVVRSYRAITGGNIAMFPNLWN